MISCSLNFMKRPCDCLMNTRNLRLSAAGSCTLPRAANTAAAPWIRGLRGFIILRKGCSPSCGTVIRARRGCFSDGRSWKKIGFLDLQTAFVSDLDFVQRASARTSFVMSRKPSAIYCIGSLTPHSNGTYPFDKMWPAWPHMVRNLTNDPQLPNPVKQEVQLRLDRQFRDQLFILVLRYLYQNKTEDAWKAQNILDKEFKCWFQAAVLRSAIAIHKRLGQERAFALWSFCLTMRRRWRSLRMTRAARLENQEKATKAAPYATFLDVSTYPNPNQ